MAGRLAFVPKLGEWNHREPAARSQLGGASSPPRKLYRDLIRSVAVSGGQYIRHPVHAGSSYSSASGTSNSHLHLSNKSDCSSGSASGAGRADFCAHDHELSKIARRMVGDGYARRMVNAFGSGGSDRAALETWFCELDVDWVLQIHEEHDLRRQLQDKSAPSLQDLVERWIRALTVIAVSVTELIVTTDDDTPAVARFGKASMAKMLVFIDAIIHALKEEKLRALVDMYTCLSSASDRFTLLLVCPAEAQTILNEISGSLSTEVIRLREQIFSTMKDVRTLVEDDDLWAIEIPRGRGEVHRNTRFMVDCIMCTVKAGLGGLTVDSVNYLKDLLLRKSQICSDPGLRYLFLLNNFYLLAAQLSEPCPGDHTELTFFLKRELTSECSKFVDGYLQVSWGHVLSHIHKTVLMDTCFDVSCRPMWLCRPKTGWRQHRKKISSLAKFESAFHGTYQAQKFWKVQDPQLRDALRRTIRKRVISEYRRYLKKHPELEKDVSSSPDVLKEMLGELFEG